MYLVKGGHRPQEERRPPESPPASGVGDGFAGLQRDTGQHAHPQQSDDAEGAAWKVGSVRHNQAEWNLRVVPPSSPTPLQPCASTARWRSTQKIPASTSSPLATTHNH